MRSTPTCGLSVIEYRPDLSNSRTKSIPLGVILEINEPGFGVIGLLARTSLTTREFNKLDGIAQQQLKDPPKFITGEIDRAMEQAPSAILEHLAREHSWSFHITAPTITNLPNELADLDTPEEIISHLALRIRREAEKIGIKGPKKPAARKAGAPKRRATAHRRLAAWPYAVKMTSCSTHAAV